MKYLLLALVTLAPTLAFADAKFVCSNITGSDRGYIVRETEEGADLLYQSLEGPLPIAMLECYSPSPTGQHPNVPHVTLLCKDKDGLYEFSMSSGGVVGISSMLRIRNARAVALGCRFNN